MNSLNALAHSLAIRIERLEIVVESTKSHGIRETLAGQRLAGQPLGLPIGLGLNNMLAIAQKAVGLD
ncbi:MAG: hypothetical protein U5O39_18090 [Gammaproteobacteria bacterium]|nr:hypothetical protein [Gammaproteobacteria bacterium]